MQDDDHTGARGGARVKLGRGIQIYEEWVTPVPEGAAGERETWIARRLAEHLDILRNASAKEWNGVVSQILNEWIVRCFPESRSSNLHLVRARASLCNLVEAGFAGRPGAPAAVLQRRRDANLILRYMHDPTIPSAARIRTMADARRVIEIVERCPEGTAKGRAAAACREAGIALPHGKRGYEQASVRSRAAAARRRGADGR